MKKLEMMRKTDLSDEVETEVAFDASSDINREVLKDGFLVNSSRGNPSELFIASHTSLQVRR